MENRKKKGVTITDEGKVHLSFNRNDYKEGLLNRGHLVGKNISSLFVKVLRNRCDIETRKFKLHEIEAKVSNYDENLLCQCIDMREENSDKLDNTNFKIKYDDPSDFYLINQAIEKFVNRISPDEVVKAFSIAKDRMESKRVTNK